MADRQGVEIDFCPQCRGVWLDRGELDKIIERSGLATNLAPAQPASDRPPAMQPLNQGYRRDDDDDDDYRRRYGSDYDRHGRKKKSFLGDLFDF